MPPQCSVPGLFCIILYIFDTSNAHARFAGMKGGLIVF